MKVTKFFLSLFNYPKKSIRKDKSELIEFKNILNEAYMTYDALDGFVKFITIIAKWHDSEKVTSYINKLEEVNYGQHDALLIDLRLLNQYISKNGRDLNGFNRTNKGEDVVEDKIYFRGNHGIYTNTIAFWKTKEKGVDSIELKIMNHIKKYSIGMTKVINQLIAL